MTAKTTNRPSTRNPFDCLAVRATRAHHPGTTATLFAQYARAVASGTPKEDAARQLVRACAYTLLPF